MIEPVLGFLALILISPFDSVASSLNSQIIIWLGVLISKKPKEKNKPAKTTPHPNDSSGDTYYRRPGAFFTSKSVKLLVTLPPSPK